MRDYNRLEGPALNDRGGPGADEKTVQYALSSYALVVLEFPDTGAAISDFLAACMDQILFGPLTG